MTDQMPIQPRLLTKAQAAAYVGLVPAAYDRLRREGRLPGYVTGMHRIDKVALDAAIDKMSGVSAAKPAKEDGETSLARFIRERNERKAIKAGSGQDKR